MYQVFTSRLISSNSLWSAHDNVDNHGEHVENQNKKKKKKNRKETSTNMQTNKQTEEEKEQEGDEHEHANKQTEEGEREAVAQLNTHEMLVWWGKK